MILLCSLSWLYEDLYVSGTSCGSFLYDKTTYMYPCTYDNQNFIEERYVEI